MVHHLRADQIATQKSLEVAKLRERNGVLQRKRKFPTTSAFTRSDIDASQKTSFGPMSGFVCYKPNLLGCATLCDVRKQVKG
mmetsp:Transcript_60247/g.90815  ORF Transcript_60247/g.90815 Transcript_60247/m.90815 type:complete len:82 (-) Transcript_60247:42-287(-)